ncbi:Lipoprotein OS=Streptomyces alboniger OX=132473 GN=CP975_32065 PE=4 SV=1 [Streptomyces alboniger]
MSYTHKRAVAQSLLAVSALLTGTFLTACSGGSSAASSSKSLAPADRALAYSECMRKNGVANFPDPQPDGGGIRLSPDDGVTPTRRRSRTRRRPARTWHRRARAQGGGSGGGGTIDSAKVAAWAKCVRQNGVPKFPDPEVNGSSMSIDIAGSGVDPADPKFRTAMQKCQSKYPGGSVQFGGGGGPQ